MKSVIGISVILKLVHECVSVGNERVFLSSQRQTESFCYIEKRCEPTKWAEVCKTGTNQSPINIIPSGRARPAFVPVSSFTAPHFEMWNIGQSIVVAFTPVDDRSRIVSEMFPGYGLSTRRYRFDNGHFHWGKSSKVGSEHLINGRSHSMELHLVHFSEKFESAEKALGSKDPLALAVVAIFFQVDPTAPPSEVLAPIVNQLRAKKFQNVSTERVLIKEEIDWTSIIPTRHSLPARVFNYQGSLTTPNCNEQVDWFVYEKPNKISESDIEAFRTIMGNIDRPLVQNHRPVQPLNDRRVTALIA